MKNANILNPELISAIAAIGHTELFAIADAGLPIPKGVQVVDLSLVAGVPGFLQTLQAVCSELVVEGATVAREMEKVSPEHYEKTRELLRGMPMEKVSHEEFKALLPKVRTVVRTGETSSYCNVILRAGVNF